MRIASNQRGLWHIVPGFCWRTVWYDSWSCFTNMSLLLIRALGVVWEFTSRRPYKRTLHLVMFCLSEGRIIWGVQHWLKKFNSELLGGWLCFIWFFFVTGHLQALFDTTTTCLRWIPLMKREGLTDLFPKKGIYMHVCFQNLAMNLWSIHIKRLEFRWYHCQKGYK